MHIKLQKCDGLNENVPCKLIYLNARDLQLVELLRMD